MKIYKLLLSLALPLLFNLPAFADETCDLSRSACLKVIVNSSIPLPLETIMTDKASGQTDEDELDRRELTLKIPNQFTKQTPPPLIMDFQNHPGRCVINLPKVKVGTVYTWEIFEQNGKYDCRPLN